MSGPELEQRVHVLCSAVDFGNRCSCCPGRHSYRAIQRTMAGGAGVPNSKTHGGAQILDVKEQVIMEIMNSVTSNMPDVDYRLLDDIIRVKLARYDVTLREEGLVVYTAQMTNEDILQKYMVCKKIAGLSDRTLDYYRYTLTAWLRFLNKPLSDTSPDDIRMYFAYLQTYTNNSPKTINNHRRNLSAFYQWLNDEEICKSNPVRRVPQMKEQYVPKKAFSNRELEKIRCAAAEYGQ